MGIDLIEPIIVLASIFGVFLWLRNDIKNHRTENQKSTELIGEQMQQQREELQQEFLRLRAEMHSDFARLETKVDGLDSRLRALESEQARITGLLEGLGLAGALPTSTT